MASLQAQKRRIKSIDSTSNIARAMELVSSVKLKKLKYKYEQSIRYLNELEKVINEVLYLTENDFKFNKEGIDVNIVITSNLDITASEDKFIPFSSKALDTKSFVFTILAYVFNKFWYI